jgi:hypothetical protein
MGPIRFIWSLLLGSHCRESTRWALVSCPSALQRLSLLMPGLSKNPQAMVLDVDEEGQIIGLDWSCISALIMHSYPGVW